MTKKNTDGFVVAFAFDAAGGETVPKAVKSHLWKPKLLLEFIEVCAVGTGLRGVCGVGENVEVPADYLLQGTDQCQQVTGHGDFPDGVLGLGFVDDEFGVFLLPIYQVNSLDCFADTDDSGSYIDIIPLQGAYFADAQSCIKANEDTQILEGEVFFNICH